MWKRRAVGVCVKLLAGLQGALRPLIRSFFLYFFPNPPLFCGKSNFLLFSTTHDNYNSLTVLPNSLLSESFAIFHERSQYVCTINNIKKTHGDLLLKKNYKKVQYFLWTAVSFYRLQTVYNMKWFDVGDGDLWNIVDEKTYEDRVSWDRLILWKVT